MELMKWVRAQHKGVIWSFENMVGSLTADQLVERPGGVGNSIGWLIWHMARTEDVMVNTGIRGIDQVLISQGWADKLGISDQRIGTGFGDDEIEEFGMSVNASELEGYWRAVNAETSQWLMTATPEDLDIKPDLEAHLQTVPPIMGESSQGAFTFWAGRSAGFLLSGSVISHGYIHLGEMQAIRGRLGVSAWF